MHLLLLLPKTHVIRLRGEGAPHDCALSCVLVSPPLLPIPSAAPCSLKPNILLDNALFCERENLIRHPPVPCLTACSMCQGGHTL